MKHLSQSVETLLPGVSSFGLKLVFRKILGRLRQICVNISHHNSELYRAKPIRIRCLHST